MLLFCYGSLEFAEVMREVTGRAFAGEPATLDGYARYRVREADFPGLVLESGAQTPGTLYRALDGAAIAALDRFEGALYERKTLDVRRLDGGLAAAQVYLVPESQRHRLSSEPWDKLRFASDQLDAFLSRIRVD